MGSTAFAATGPAQASLPGTGSVLTTSNGSNALKFYGASPSLLTNPVDSQMIGASWSPDGSRAAYIDQDGGISSIRFNGAGDILYILPPEDSVLRSSVSWRGNGSSVVWAERDGSGNGTNRWAIRVAPSSSLFSGGQLTPDDGQDYLNPDGGVEGLVVFQRQADNGSGTPTGQAAVMLYNPNSGVEVVDDNGSNPAISPDGKRVAFVRAGQIITSDLAGEDEIVVATGTNDNPTWSPDGKTLAFTRGGGVSTALADGSQSGAPVTVSGASGVPAYQPRNKDRAIRLAGSNRFTTATASSQSHWATYGASADQREQAQVAVLSRSDTFADALAGSALAAAKGGPLLMTPTASLNVDTANELKRTLAPGATVYVLGSEGALSATVFNAVTSLGFHPVRLAGSNRFSTSVAIAKEINPNPELVLLATGMNFPDALAAGAAAGSYRGDAVVVLTQDAKMPADTKAFLDTLPADSRYLFGIGKSAYQAGAAYDSSTIDVLGENRFETAYMVAWWFFGGPNHVGLATGMDWPDALSGGALMGRLNGPLLLTWGTQSELSAAATWGLDETSGSVHTGLVFGSAAVVNSGQHSQLGTWIGGPLGSNLLTNATDVGISLAPLKSGANLRQADAAASDVSGVRSPEELAAAQELQKLRERLRK
ncbi:cell wall-binding repeat-containing protein [Micromonospora sp. NPDC049836]|uniref:cell wall-binding repeat-containing protein n=1 Tax=Micromonospora sp. NPDC049836 TaxID=3364274 RepID=UPI00378B771F